MLYTIISTLGPYMVKPFPDDAAAQACLEEIVRHLASQRVVGIIPGIPVWVPEPEWLARWSWRRATEAEAAVWRGALAEVRREKGPGFDQSTLAAVLPKDWPGRMPVSDEVRAEVDRANRAAGLLSPA